MRRSVVFAIVLFFAAVGLYATLGRPVRPAPPRPARFLLVPADGRDHLYSLSWRVGQHAAVPVASSVTELAGSQSVEGTLRLGDRGLHGDRRWVQLRFEELRAAEATLQEAPLVHGVEEARAQLLGESAMAELLPTGEVVAVRMRQEAAPLFQALVTELLWELDLRGGSGSAWTVPEETASGVAPTGYRLSAE